MSYILQGAGPAFYFTVVPIPRLQELWGVGLPVVWVASHLQVECSRRSILSGFTVLPRQLFFFESSSPIPCVGLLDLNMWAP